VIFLLSVSMEINRPFIRHSHWRRGLMGKVELVFTHSCFLLTWHVIHVSKYRKLRICFVLEYRNIIGLAYAY